MTLGFKFFKTKIDNTETKKALTDTAKNTAKSATKSTAINTAKNSEKKPRFGELLVAHRLMFNEMTTTYQDFELLGKEFQAITKRFEITFENFNSFANDKPVNETGINKYVHAITFLETASVPVFSTKITAINITDMLPEILAVMQKRREFILAHAEKIVELTEILKEQVLLLGRIGEASLRLTRTGYIAGSGFAALIVSMAGEPKSIIAASLSVLSATAIQIVSNIRSATEYLKRQGVLRPKEKYMALHEKYVNKFTECDLNAKIGYANAYGLTAKEVILQGLDDLDIAIGTAIENENAEKARNKMTMENSTENNKSNESNESDKRDENNNKHGKKKNKPPTGTPPTGYLN